MGTRVSRRRELKTAHMVEGSKREAVTEGEEVQWDVRSRDGQINGSIPVVLGSVPIISVKAIFIKVISVALWTRIEELRLVSTKKFIQ